MTSALRLRAPLERLYQEFDWAARIEKDAIRFPLRYSDPADREVAALLAACLAYGRVDLFAPWIDRALACMGPSPHRFILSFDPEKDGTRFEGFHYRFNRPRDLAAFCLASQRLLVRYGSLRAYFVAGYSDRDPDVGPALERFVDGFLTQDLTAIFPRGRLSRGYRHLFPRPSRGGPCKRLHLFLRWMVRRVPPDFGTWREIPPSKLIIPVDTHVENMSRAIGLTRRRSRSWRMAAEITTRLRLLDAEDPVKYDFSLCHKRMSGDCRDRRDLVVCAPCGLRGVCRHWKNVGGGPRPRPAGAGPGPLRGLPQRLRGPGTRAAGARSNKGRA
ncbi:MAG: TIGR02757 family protein [Candidatus Rokubacteria bacterium]|nr:TIGR02757 family protein [Candidatus Rokubacteria bacterium]